MSCHLCFSNFTVFKKEHGCKNCGFAFCGKCCNKKIVLAHLGTSKQLVCQQCYDNLIRPKNNVPNFASGQALPSIDQSGPSKQSHFMPSQKYEGLSKEDAELLLRLDKLKQNSATSCKVTTADIETRLAQLKGVDPKQKPITIYKCSQPLTQVEKTELLLQQMKEEVAIDKMRPSAEQEVEERFRRLKGFAGKSSKIQNTLAASEKQNDLNKSDGEGADSKEYNNIDLDKVNTFFQKVSKESQQNAEKELSNLYTETEVQDYLSKFQQQQPKKSKGKELNWNDHNDYSSEDNEDDSDEEATKKLIQQLMAEDHLDQDLKKANIDINTFPSVKMENTKKDEENDELPWCSICNEDAQLRCHGCDGDIYCNRCFRLCHDEFELHDHTTSPYKGKN